MESFRNSDSSKLSAAKLEILKGVSTRSVNIQETDRIEKKKILLSNENKAVSKLLVRTSRYVNRHCMMIEKFKEVSNFPNEGEQIRIVTQQQINAFTLLQMIHSEVGIDELYCTSYNFSSIAIQSLMHFLSSGCQQMTIVANESMKQMAPKRYDDLNNAYKAYKGRLKVAIVHNHTKITLIRTKDNRFFVIEGSGNFSDNVKIEQYLFEQSKDTFQFHQQWIENFFSEDYRKMKRDVILM